MNYMTGVVIRPYRFNKLLHEEFSKVTQAKNETHVHKARGHIYLFFFFATLHFQLFLTISPISYVFLVTPSCSKTISSFTHGMMSSCLWGFPTFAAQPITHVGRC